MYVRAKSYEASTIDDFEAPYRCVHCGYETIGRAFAYGHGTGFSPYGIDDGGAAARAARYAQSAARRQARLSIQIAPCPRCQKHDRRAVFDVYRNALLTCAVILVAPVLLLAWGGDRLSDSVIIGLIGGGIAAALYWKHKTPLILSRQVRFDPPSNAPEPSDIR